MGKSWFYVFLTSLFEMIWIFALNTASEWWHWILIICMIPLDLHFLAKACEGLPTGTVYAVFAAAGTIGAALMDIFLFGGELNITKVLFIMVLVAGVIGLHLSDNKERAEA